MDKLFLILQTIWVVSALTDDYTNSNTRYVCHPLNYSTPSTPDWGAVNVNKELEDIIKERKECPEKLIDIVAYRGKPLSEYRATLRDMNLLMRKNYAAMIEKIGRNIYPVIIAADAEAGFEGVGSSYTLFLEDGTTKHMAPTPPEYEMLKDLGHMPLGVFSIISSYFYTPKSLGWHVKLGQYQNIVRESLDAALHSGLKNDSITCKNQPFIVEDQIRMLTLVDNYINGCFENNSVDFESYQNFTAEITPLVQRAQ